MLIEVFTRMLQMVSFDVSSIIVDEIGVDLFELFRQCIGDLVDEIAMKIVFERRAPSEPMDGYFEGGLAIDFERVDRPRRLLWTHVDERNIHREYLEVPEARIDRWLQ